MIPHKLLYILLPIAFSGSNINSFLTVAEIEQAVMNDDSIFKISPVLVILLICAALVVSATFFFVIYQQKINYKEKTFELENTDHLTGERNWQYFINDAEKLLKDNPYEIFSVMQINIRNFKYINDVYSSLEGDELLKYLAKIISAHLEKNEIQTRVNADNFIILLRNSDTQGVLKFFNEIKLEMHKRVGNNVDDIFGDIYCGIYLGGNEPQRTVSEMCECASIALRKASGSKLNYVFYEEKLRLDVTRESIINKSMYDALRNKEFQFYLQPQHNIKQNNRISSAEALVRWIKPDGSLIFPNDFIPIFERNGFIVELDRYIFEEVCKFIKANLMKGWFSDLRIAVNVSRYDLMKRDFVDFYTQIKNFYEIPDNRIELEFTESVVFEDYETFKSILKALKENGFLCSLDDFGAGSSSLNVLKELSVDILKMDRLFFVGSENEKRNNSLIASVIAMARGLDMKIVAEGIEETEQIDFLRRIGCDMIQGYVFSKPIPLPEFIEYVKQYRGFGTSEIRSLNELATGIYENDKDKIIRQKYVSTLNFVHALVMEIDLDADNFRIVSFGSGEYYYPVISGSFTLESENYTLSMVIEEDRENFRQTCNLQHILSCFYRGDETVLIEFRAKTYNKEIERFSSNYEWHCMTLQRLNFSDKTRMMAMLYIQNIQEKYDNRVKLKKSQNRLLMALHGIKGTVYEVNILKSKINLVQDSFQIDNFTISDGSTFKQLSSYIEKYIHEDDRKKLLDICNKPFLEKFILNRDESLFMEFRRITDNNEYIWKSICLTKNSDEPYILLMLIQDISSVKLTEEKLVNSEKILRSLIDNVFANVTEIDLNNNSFRVIKSSNPDFWEVQNLNYDEMVEFTSSDFPIHPDYKEKMKETMSRVNIMKEFSEGNNEVYYDYPLYHGGRYIWYSITIKRESENGMSAIMLVTDIDRQKKEQERVNNRIKETESMHVDADNNSVLI